MAEKFDFEELFTVSADGRVTPKVWVQIGPARLGPGASFGPGGLQYGNIDVGEWRHGVIIWGHREGDVIVVEMVSRDTTGDKKPRKSG